MVFVNQVTALAKIIVQIDDLVRSHGVGDAFNINVPDCLHMQLAQNREESPVVYSGSGYIRLAEDGRLEFKIYATAATNTDAFTALKAVMDVASGTIYASTDLYTLTAIDRFRNSWTAERILPDANWPGPESLPIVQGKLDVLRTTSGHFPNRARNTSCGFISSTTASFPART